ncbi:IS1595 family transposase [Siculibacillus lacustris]|uniref:IS1595 family transposase n=1 Tax=Siculibacillus lacustris TaxID=1549641 RepID=A0A4Q9VER6_9HYPH|nr:IS1595 family transposase [Siculibacillus lacustris]
MADVIEELAAIKTVVEMTEAFRDEAHCRRLLEQMIWPRGRICPGCGCRQSVTLAGRDVGRRARPGLYQCSNGDCRMQFTATTRTPLHSTKLPIRTWLAGLWFMLQTDKAGTNETPSDYAQADKAATSGAYIARGASRGRFAPVSRSVGAVGKQVICDTVGRAFEIARIRGIICTTNHVGMRHCVETR